MLAYHFPCQTPYNTVLAITIKHLAITIKHFDPRGDLSLSLIFGFPSFLGCVFQYCHPYKGKKKIK